MGSAAQRCAANRETSARARSDIARRNVPLLPRSGSNGTINLGWVTPSFGSSARLSNAVNMDGVVVVRHVDATVHHRRRRELHERAQAVAFGLLLAVPQLLQGVRVVSARHARRVPMVGAATDGEGGPD